MVARRQPRQGEIWWGEATSEMGRPYLVLTRDDAIPVLKTILVAPVTRRVRGISTEVPLGQGDGLDVDCVASIDNTMVADKSMLTRRVGELAVGRFATDVCRALRTAVAC